MKTYDIFSDKDNELSKSLAELRINAVRNTNNSYCGHCSSEEKLENKLWEFVEGYTTESEHDKLLDQVLNCSFCISTVNNILTGIEQAEKVTCNSLEDIKKHVLGEEDTSCLKVIFSKINNVVKLLDTNGILQPLEAAAVKRSGGDTNDGEEKLFIKKQMGDYSVGIFFWTSFELGMNLDITILDVPKEQPKEKVYISLYDNEGLVESHSLSNKAEGVGNKVRFEKLKFQDHTLKILKEEQESGEVKVSFM